jgi:hypothetical protein
MMTRIEVRSRRRVSATRLLTFLLLVAMEFVFLLIPAAARTNVGTAAQSANETPKAPQAQGVVSTAGAHAAELDAEKRPITAGGFVDSGPIVCQDVAEKAGLTRWRHVMSTPQKTYILETVGSLR